MKVSALYSVFFFQELWLICQVSLSNNRNLGKTLLKDVLYEYLYLDNQL